jgi:lysylphosphatidylglycerol synthetase-like protein (DUF2156 family)
MNTAHSLNVIQQKMEARAIKRETKHLTAPLWRMAIVAVCLIVVWVAVFRVMHTAAMSEVQRANDAR